MFRGGNVVRGHCWCCAARARAHRVRPFASDMQDGQCAPAYLGVCVAPDAWAPIVAPRAAAGLAHGHALRGSTSMQMLVDCDCSRNAFACQACCKPWIHTHMQRRVRATTRPAHTPPCLHTLHAASHAHRAWPHASAPMRNRAATIVRACAALPTPHRTWRLEPYFRHHLCRVLLEDKLLLLSSPPVKQRAHLLDAQPLQPVVVPACVHQPCTCASGCRAWPGGAGRARAGAPCISVQAVYRTRTTGVTGEPAEHGKVEVWLPLPQAGPLAGPPEQAARGLIAPAGSGTGKRTSSARPAPRQPSARPPLLQTCA